MTDVLIYWRDYSQNWSRRFSSGQERYWHSNARLVGALSAEDRLWLVTAGRYLPEIPAQGPHLGFLVDVRVVREVVPNPGEDPAYRRDAYRYRVASDSIAESLVEHPICVDAVLRPAGAQMERVIGTYLQGPRKISGEILARLETAAFPSDSSR